MVDVSNIYRAMRPTTLLPQSTDPDAATSSDATMGAEDDDSENNSQPFRNSMSGIRFPAMSAAGPSGARPEHVKEMLAIRRRSIANGLYKAISALRKAGEKGSLPECARWILGSRLVFLKKKAGPKPRPI